MNEIICSNKDLGNIAEINVHSNCSLVSFVVKFCKLINCCRYFVVLQLQADFGDGDGFVNVAILNKKFCAINNRIPPYRCINYNWLYGNNLFRIYRCINYNIFFNNIVIDVPICKDVVKYRIKLIGINCVGIIKCRKKLNKEDNDLNDTNSCCNKYIGKCVIKIHSS